MTEEQTTAPHAVELVSFFNEKGWHAECECGWKGRTRSTQDGALADVYAHLGLRGGS